MSTVRRSAYRNVGHLAPDWFPPHVLVTDADEDVVFLATAHGVLHSAHDGTPASATRFLDEAAKALPTAGYMDLIGELVGVNLGG